MTTHLRFAALLLLTLGLTASSTNAQGCLQCKYDQFDECSFHCEFDIGNGTFWCNDNCGQYCLTGGGACWFRETGFESQQVFFSITEQEVIALSAADTPDKAWLVWRLGRDGGLPIADQLTHGTIKTLYGSLGPDDVRHLMRNPNERLKNYLSNKKHSATPIEYSYSVDRVEDGIRILISGEDQLAPQDIKTLEVTVSSKTRRIIEWRTRVRANPLATPRFFPRPPVLKW